MYRFKLCQQTPLYERNLDSFKFITLHRWWTSSSKTYSNIGSIVTWLITGKISNDYYDDTTKQLAGKPLVIEKGTCQIYRKTKEALRWSVQRDLENILKNTILIDQKWEQVVDKWVGKTLWDFLEVNKTNRSYSYQGRMIELCWADDEQKLRWPRREIAYINEANELTEEEFMQIELRTKYKIFIDFNPSDEDIWLNHQIEIERSVRLWDVDVIISTHRDNPFLLNRQREAIESLKWRNPKAYLVYGKGEYGRVEGLVFKNWDIVSEIPEECKFLAYWLDFWFTNDPAAMIYVGMMNGEIYLHELIYETGLNNRGISQKSKKLWVWETDEIIADSAEPKSIDEIYHYWLSGIRPAVKWPWSHLFGIGIMLNYKFHITSSSTNLIKEFNKYCYIQDKNGKWLNETIDDFNHGIDAVKYVISKKLKPIAEITKKRRIVTR